MAHGKRLTLPQFIVEAEALRGSRTVLRGPELHHLRVRRLRVGSELLLSDGQGKQRHGVVVEIDRHQAIVGLSVDQPLQRESPLRLVLAQALLKADKMDCVVEKATELGVAELLIFSSERCFGQASGKRQSRWSRIAQSAAKQSQRSAVPAISAPLQWRDVLARPEAVRLLFWEGPGTSSLAAIRRARARADSVLAIVGPEGGFSAAEAQHAAGSGVALVGLGPRILRAETAAIVATTLVEFLWGDLAADVL
jgi:16S rRNA (uracil1498-N3)-methyltransferase